MRTCSYLLSCALLALSVGSNAAIAQRSSWTQPSPPDPYIPPDGYRDDGGRSGPRFGIADIIGGSVTAERAGHPISPLTTLFGWQAETPYSRNASAVVPVTEFVVLVGGAEQGVFLPSASWLVGLRLPSGMEAAVGPTMTGSGLQLAVAAGVTRSVGELNVPINLAVAPGRRGASISITTGFNVPRRR